MPITIFSIANTKKCMRKFRTQCAETFIFSSLRPSSTSQLNSRLQTNYNNDCKYYKNDCGAVCV